MRWGVLLDRPGQSDLPTMHEMERAVTWGPASAAEGSDFKQGLTHA